MENRGFFATHFTITSMNGVWVNYSYRFCEINRWRGIDMGRSIVMVTSKSRDRQGFGRGSIRKYW